MNIVYISSSIIPSRAANSVHVMKMCQAFSKNGHKTILLAPDVKEGLELEVEDIFEYYGVEKNFILQKLAWPSIKGRGYIYGFIAAKAALKHKPDIIYCRDLVGCYFSALNGAEVIYEAHSPIIDSGRLSEWLFKRLIKRKELQKLVVITHALKKYFIDTYSLPHEMIQVAPDGADPIPKTTQPIQLKNKGKRLQAGYVGHLYSGKGMEIIHKLAKLCPWADFNIIGGTEQDLIDWKINCKNTPNLIFHGFKPQNEVQQYLISLDVALLPNQRKVNSFGGGNSNIAEWTSPLKAFEYMSAKKAIIASDLPVLKEIFTHNKTALLCNPDDVSEWALALTKLDKNLPLREKLSINAYDAFIGSLTWGNRASRLLNNPLS